MRSGLGSLLEWCFWPGHPYLAMGAQVGVLLELLLQVLSCWVKSSSLKNKTKYVLYVNYKVNHHKKTLSLYLWNTLAVLFGCSRWRHLFCSWWKAGSELINWLNEKSTLGGAPASGFLFWKWEAFLISRMLHQDDTTSWNPPGLCLKGT
jgi:hypothetical protein